jgi:hypothetical protein
MSSLKVVIAGLGKFVEKTVKKITLDATANLIEDTPRDLGWARVNWIPSLGSPSLSGNVSNPSEGEVGAARRKQDQGIARVVTGFRLGSGKVYISNNVPYIMRLNEGSSTQAPAGFVQASIARAVRGAFTSG